MSTILICDDEPDIVNALKIYLESAGYETESAGNGEEALRILSEKEIHLVLLDVMMPVMDGIETLSKLREYSNVPVILLTAKSEDTDKIMGLSSGADDYITKPFNPMELLARVKSCLRRYLLLGGSADAPAASQDAGKFVVGGIELSDREKTVFLDGEPVSLTPTEYDILKLFMENPGKVFSPDEIYRELHHEAGYGAEGSIAVHIRHLREKLEYDPAEPRFLKAVWGRGYVLSDRDSYRGRKEEKGK